MNTKDLIFYNSAGNHMNLNFDEGEDLYSGSIYFDRNSTDTYKTQGIYLFEKIESTNNTFNAYLDKYQIFNTNGFKSFPKFNTQDFIITDIKLSVIDATYNTKWIYATGIEKYFYQGMWCSIEGLDGFHNTDFNTTVVNKQTFKVLAVEKNKVLVWTTTNNITPLPVYISTTAKIIPLNVIEVQQGTEPVWNETSLNAKLYSGKKISYNADTENAGIYTINDVCNLTTRDYHILNPNLFVPTLSVSNKIKIDIKLKTSNIKVTEGSISFVNVIGADDYLTVPYIPTFLKVADQIRVENTIVLGNDALLTITSIDRILNRIYVVDVLSNETVITGVMYLGTNIFTIEQELLIDNDNLMSIPLTYWSIVNKYSTELLNLPGGYKLEYNTTTDTLHITSEFNHTYATITVSKIINDVTTVITNGTTWTSNTYNLYLLDVVEELVIEDSIDADSTIYNRSIKFTSIDSNGLNIRINGINYNVIYDTSVIFTITDWMNEFALGLIPLGITATFNGTDTLNIQSDYPNVPVFVELSMGDFSVYKVLYKDITFNKIKSQLLITIDSKDYLIMFDTDDNTTVTNWVNTHKDVLTTYNILVSNTGNILHIDLLDPEKTVDITYNIGYTPKSGDLSVYEILFATNSTGSIITGNEIKVTPGTYNFLDYYATGQKISIHGADKKTQNKYYNIIGLENDTISVSYQGAFWQQALSDINIISDYFIRFPKSGYEGNNTQTKLIWTWKDTQVSDFFMYDFSGDQLAAYTNGFPEYNGITPLCGVNGEIELKLNKKPNTDINFISEPTKQQTIFDTINYTLPFIDNNETAGVEPSPLQAFFGYKAGYEGWNKARLFLDIIEDVTFNVTSNAPVVEVINLDGSVTRTCDDMWKFTSNYVEVLYSTLPVNFITSGFVPGQIVQFTSTDINTDNKKIATLDNAGILYKIKEVLTNKIIFTTDVIEEISIKNLPKTTLPFYDISGNQLMVNRLLNVAITVQQKTIAYFDVFGESESEDERHAINLNNKNLNILKLQDVFIFKDVDIKEQGIDWIYLNRKRKELIEIYPEIFNNLASYKSVIQAINFFGYNDLSFTEYFQNINPESKKFGQLMNMELLNIFDKSVAGWEFSNLAYENLRNEGYRKTNLFALNYKITDMEGNFINAYSLDEVKIKLLGLKRWLTENIIPIGTKIADINGKYQMAQNFTLAHETYMTKTFRVEEYSAPVDFNVTGYLQPITTQSNTYDISVDFFAADTIEWYQYKIRTFYLETWTAKTYLPNSIVIYNNVIYTNTAATISTEIPGINPLWIITTVDTLQTVQIISDYKWQADNVSFTINALIDPYFIIEVYWHSGYATTHKTIKSFSIQ